MSGILSGTKTVKISDGLECEVSNILGSGTQGEVYAINCEGNNIVLKWYFPNMATPTQQEILEQLIKSGTPSETFIWPIKIVKIEGVEGFGYIMPFKETRYKSFSLWMGRRVEPSFRVLITSCLQLAHNFFLLHLKGLCYRDISLNNIFFDPSNGDIRIGDTDNIIVDGENKGNILGTPKFMAPEIVQGRALPSVQTDLFSLSVLLFYILFVNHPLEGKKETTFKSLDIPAMKKLYGEEATFIFDPWDDRNEPDPKFHENAIIFWEIYPKFIRDLFTKAFTAGLKDPVNGRVRESEWRLNMANLRDLIIYCNNCGAENFHDPAKDKKETSSTDSQICRGCKKIISHTLRLHIGKKVIMLNQDTRLYPHHINPHTEYDFSNPVAAVTLHPKDPTLWGLRNLTPDKWGMQTKDGKIFDIEQGKNVPLRNGTMIYFGNSTGEIH